VSVEHKPGIATAARVVVVPMLSHVARWQHVGGTGVDCKPWIVSCSRLTFMLAAQDGANMRKNRAKTKQPMEDDKHAI
jgi:hypothetical protein